MRGIDSTLAGEVGDLAAIDLEDTLRQLATGASEWMADRVTLSDEEDGFLAAADILEPALLEPLLQRYAATYPGSPRRAVVSMWSQYYFGFFVPPVVAVQLVAGLALDVELTATGVIVDGTGCPVKLKLGRGQPLPDREADGFLAYSRLLQHLDRLVPSLASAAGLSPKVMWSNVGVVLEWIIDEIRETGRASATRIAMARELLDCRLRPDGSRNPLYEPTRPPDPDRDNIRFRKLCCQRLDLCGVEACPTCPDRR